MITFDKTNNFFFSTKINSANTLSGFSTKAQGDARKDENLIDFFQKLDISDKIIVRAKQTHSTNIHIIEKISQEKIHTIQNVDGFITKEKNVILTAMTADCVPIIFADKKNRAIGVSHQGWKGTYHRMAQKMVEKMCEIGAEKEEIIAAIGPAIGSCCYEIYGERLELFEKEFSPSSLAIKLSSQFIIYKREEKYYLNLNYLNYLQLLEVGLQKKNIDFFPFCTKCNSERFYSYQRDSKETFGEMVHYILNT